MHLERYDETPLFHCAVWPSLDQAFSLELALNLWNVAKPMITDAVYCLSHRVARFVEQVGTIEN